MAHTVPTADVYLPEASSLWVAAATFPLNVNGLKITPPYS